MLRPELLTRTQRELEAQRIEREWYVIPTPDLPARPKPCVLYVSTTYNPEPFEWCY